MQSLATNPARLDDPNEAARYDAEHGITAECDGCRCTFHTSELRPYAETPTTEAGTFCTDCAPEDAPAASVHAFHLARFTALRTAA